MITAHGLHGFGAASLSPPVGAGAGAGAEIGASQGASIGTTIMPGIGTAIGAIVGAIGGAIAGALGKADPENVDFDQAVAIYNQNPTAIYSLQNPYLALAGLFDLNIGTNIPIYRKFGHMGEAAFVVWLCNTVYQAALAGKITASDTALTVMNKIVQPAINAWGYGAMSDPHASLITALIVAMILQYTEGAEANWLAVGGDYPAQFNSIPKFALPGTAAAQPQSGSKVATPQAPPVPTNMTSAIGAKVTAPGTALTSPNQDTIVYFGAQAAGDPNNQYGLPVWLNGTLTGYAAALYIGPGNAIYAQNAQGGWAWWEGASKGWVGIAAPTLAASSSAPAAPASGAATGSSTPVAPATPTTLESADGSEVTAPGTALETPQGTMLYFGPQAAGDPNNTYGLPIWQSGSPAGYAVGMAMANGGKIYAVNALGGWSQWGTAGWSSLSAAPVLNGPTTTQSTTANSPQTGVTCTPGTPAKTTGGVVGTTSSGEAVTDTDIQDLISQMSSQNASASQTYTAIMAALQSEGVANTAGLQSQVAAQVQASVPAAPVAASSHTGLVVVGGGLALLGLMYFMGHRRK